MKKFSLVALVITTLFNSCSTDFDLTADYKEITIVYGLLNVQDNVHYVRIQKAFLDENTSALLIAQNPDSIYYGNELDVRIHQFSNGVEDAVYTLQRVDGDTLGLPKDSGIFASGPNILYRFQAALNDDKTYQLEITNTVTGNNVRAQTPLVNDFHFLFPIAGQLWNPMSPTPLTVQWRSAINGKVYDLTVRFHYKEWNENDPGNVTSKFVDVVLERNITSFNTQGGQNIQEPLDGQTFFLALKSKIPVDPVMVRQAEINPFDFLVDVGAEELYNYIRVNEAQLGITSQSALSTYTNIENGLGIFSSRYFKVEAGVGIHPNAIDSLACGSITHELGFLDSQGQDFCPN